LNGSVKPLSRGWGVPDQAPVMFNILENDLQRSKQAPGINLSRSDDVDKSLEEVNIDFALKCKEIYRRENCLTVGDGVRTNGDELCMIDVEPGLNGLCSNILDAPGAKLNELATICADKKLSVDDKTNDSGDKRVCGTKSGVDRSRSDKDRITVENKKHSPKHMESSSEVFVDYCQFYPGGHPSKTSGRNGGGV